MGETGTSGVIEVTDIAFDVADVLPGAILVENNIAGRNPGDVGLWDSHFRAGGTAGSAVETKCGSYPPHIADCKAAFMFLHLRPESSTYMESVWGWSVNRDLDGLTGQTNGTSQSIAVGRGMLIESTQGTWLVGTAFEHFVLYQYQLVNAGNVFSLMAQTETVYWQPSPPAPAPWMLVPLLTTANSCYSLVYSQSFSLDQIQNISIPTILIATAHLHSVTWAGLYALLEVMTSLSMV